MGEVYRAHDSRLERDVAIKVVGARHGEDPDALRRFAREAKIAARLTHPNVCTLFDADTDGAVAYAVLELLEGETLAARIARGPLPEPEARRIGADVARGLARAHELGFVHRDLKPQNVFLTSTGAKILDFGLARPGAAMAAGGEETASLLTEAGHLLGTVGYMAPELVRGEPPAAAADLWALGCVLFECLTGRHAFGGRNKQETFAAALTSPPEWSALPLGLSSSTRGLLERLLDKDPATRLADAAAVARLLTAGAAPSTAAPAPAKRRRLGPAAFAILGALLAVAAVKIFRERSAPIESLAVLPFSSDGSDADLAEVCASLSDDVIARISQAPNLRVMASSAVVRYAGAKTDPLTAARELDVRAVLTGHAVGRAGRVTVAAELVDANDGRHLWGERYERPLASLASLPAEIASAVAEKLHLSLSGEDRARLARRDTESREAYELWLKGHQHAGRRTEADLSQALDDFQKALDADPQFARAWAGIAEVWEVSGYTGRRPTPEAYEKAKAAARRALALDPDLADAHAVLAHATMMTGDDRTAEAEFRRALDLDANSVMALHWYSHLLMNQKRWDESLALSKRLLELDPMGFWNVHLGEHYLKKGDRALALEQFRRAVDLDPNLPNARYELGHFFLVDGRLDDAVPQLEAACRLDPESPNYRRALEQAYEKAGRPADAARLRAEADGRKP
jgi:serine/threonine protein kinase/tetratricopeptide (TPR) repeat protein